MPLYTAGGGVSAHNELTGLTSDDHSQYYSTTNQRAFGYSLGGNNDSVNVNTNEKYDDVVNTWTIKTSFTSERSGLTGFSLNGFGYIAGGDGGSISDKTDQYNQITDTWTVKTVLNTARNYLSAFTLNNYGYTAGGTTGSDSAVTEQYNDITNTWTSKGNLNDARWRLTAFSLNGLGYTIGGQIAGETNKCESYNDITNTWNVITLLSTNLSIMSGFSLNGYGYVACGSTSYLPVLQYDDIANIWNVKANVNVGRNDGSGMSLNNFGYVIGGYTASNISNDTEKYDTIANTWTSKLDINIARYGVASFSLGSISTTNLSSNINNFNHTLKNNMSYIQSNSESAFSSTIVLFEKVFPVIPQIHVTNTTNGAADIYVTSSSTIGFTFNSSTAVTFDWLAIVHTGTFRD